jgi:uncharacterized protein
MTCRPSPPALPVGVDLDQFLAAAGDDEDARLSVAREYELDSWDTLRTEVLRRKILDDVDAAALRTLVAEQPSLATAPMRQWQDHPGGPAPLGYVAMMRYDTVGKVFRDVPGTGELARVLLAAGALVNGAPGDAETPLITAASYGDTEVARVLIDAGADVDATASADAGGVPGGSALRHALVFGATEIVDLLVAAGARISSLSEAAAAGDITGWLSADTPVDDRVNALVAAADHERLDVIDQLLDAGTPIDAVNVWRGQPLGMAATRGRVGSVRHLISRGADPNWRDSEQHRTALDLCRLHNPADSPQRAQIEAVLAPLTAEPG